MTLARLYGVSKKDIALFAVYSFSFETCVRYTPLAFVTPSEKVSRTEVDGTCSNREEWFVFMLRLYVVQVLYDSHTVTVYVGSQRSLAQAAA